jgi:hypothetical protein
MTTTTTPLDPLANPPLSPSLQNEAIYQKIRLIGKVGLVLSSMMLVLFTLVLLLFLIVVILDLIDPSEKIILGNDAVPATLYSLLVLAPLMALAWCRIFRRFTPNKLLSQKTVKLIMQATILGFIGSIIPCNLVPDPRAYWIIYIFAILGAVMEALPLLALGYVLKLSLTLKEENDYTV